MKILKKLIFLLSFLALFPNTALAMEDIKLHPSGNVIDMGIKLKYPYVRTVLSKDANKLRPEDMILSIEHKDKKASSLQEIYEVMKLENKRIKVEILRNNKTKKVTMKSDELRLYELSDLMGGSGTITAIDKEGNYVALAHSVSVGKNEVSIIKGNLYETVYVQEVKSKEDRVGHLVTSPTGVAIGTIDNMTDYALKGKLNNNDYPKDMYLEVGQPQLGKAYIYCETPVTNELKLHEIEITEIGETHASIKIKDKSLLEKRGGGVCGMSGSPIIQDNKIVGGYSHVLIKDTTTGGMVKIEKMLEGNK